LLRERGILSIVGNLDRGLLLDALECVAAADETARMQERAIRDLLAEMSQR
jgi:hypothetical protein